MTYRVKIDPRALRSLTDLSPGTRDRISARIEALKADPRPPNSRPLLGELRGSFRLRIGDYRVSYDVDEEAGLIRVWAIGHRRTFYQEARRRRH
jgi:mRNA interferase RelE/StbE